MPQNILSRTGFDLLAKEMVIGCGVWGLYVENGKKMNLLEYYNRAYNLVCLAKLEKINFW